MLEWKGVVKERWIVTNIYMISYNLKILSFYLIVDEHFEPNLFCFSEAVLESSFKASFYACFTVLPNGGCKYRKLNNYGLIVNLLIFPHKFRQRKHSLTRPKIAEHNWKNVFMKFNKRFIVQWCKAIASTRRIKNAHLWILPIIIPSYGSCNFWVNYGWISLYFIQCWYRPPTSNLIFGFSTYLNEWIITWPKSSI